MAILKESNVPLALKAILGVQKSFAQMLWAILPGDRSRGSSCILWKIFGLLFWHAIICCTLL